jgi:histidinol-phosphate aminotransferase
LITGRIHVISEKPNPLPRVLDTAPAQHGAIDYVELERLGLDPDQVLDFSVNSNPFGPPPGLHAVLEQLALDVYPDREALDLRRCLADHLAVRPERIVVGNGSSELLLLIGLAFLSPGDQVLVLEPSFSEYRRVASLMGARVLSWVAADENDYCLDCEELDWILQQAAPRLVFLCNPNNPTGQVLESGLLADWLHKYPATLFVVDEAYQAFAPDFQSALDIQADNLLVLRSMTKDYALAGLRLGYAVGPERIVAALALVRPAWNVNRAAQAAGMVCLTAEGQAHLHSSLAALQFAKTQLMEGLRRLGMHPRPSQVHYFLLPVSDAKSFRRTLLRHGILVRDCASFDLPNYVRIATRRPEENQRLLNAIQNVKDGDRQ